MRELHYYLMHQDWEQYKIQINMMKKASAFSRCCKDSCNISLRSTTGAKIQYNEQQQWSTKLQQACEKPGGKNTQRQKALRTAWFPEGLKGNKYVSFLEKWLPLIPDQLDPWIPPEIRECTTCLEGNLKRILSPNPSATRTPSRCLLLCGKQGRL